jgi:hypothetical protein
MTTIPLKEIDRQYRVLRQTLSMHAMLRYGFSWKAKVSEILLLACSVVFCATTFASDDLYRFFGLVPSISRVILGIASVIAFILSLTLMVVDFKGQAALHRQAVERWSDVLAKYRKHRNDDGTWPEEVRGELDFTYWEADRNSVKIPEQRFNRLKSRYLRKVAISELKSFYPGCPKLFLAFLLRFQDTKKALRGVRTNK